MKLKLWLVQNEWSIIDFATHLGCHSVTLGGYLNRRIRLSKFIALAIELATNKEVTAQDILNENPPKSGARKTKIT